MILVIVLFCLAGTVTSPHHWPSDGVVWDKYEIGFRKEINYWVRQVFLNFSSYRYLMYIQCTLYSVNSAVLDDSDSCFVLFGRY